MRSTIANKSQEQLGLSENRVLYPKFCMVNRSIIFSFIFPIEVAISRSHLIISRRRLVEHRVPGLPGFLSTAGSCDSLYVRVPNDVLRIHLCSWGPSLGGVLAATTMTVVVDHLIYNNIYIGYVCVCVSIYSLIFFNNKLGTQSGDWDHAKGEKPRTKEDLWT